METSPQLSHAAVSLRTFLGMIQGVLQPEIGKARVTVARLVILIWNQSHNQGPFPAGYSLGRLFRFDRSLLLGYAEKYCSSSDSVSGDVSSSRTITPRSSRVMREHTSVT